MTGYLGLPTPLRRGERIELSVYPQSREPPFTRSLLTRGITTPMRKPAALLTAIAVAAGITVASPALSPAAALSPGVQFSADNLSTWQTDGVVYALATASGGRVVVGGTFNQ